LQSDDQSDPVPTRSEITFRGRGRAILSGKRLVLKVCPSCSQWNSPKAADKGHCGWCAYVPSLADAAPLFRN